MSLLHAHVDAGPRDTTSERDREAREAGGEPFEWTDEVPEDDPEFQGLLEETEDTAVYPDISAELPGVLLEEQEQDFQPLTDEPEPDFRDLASDALYNAGVNTDEAL